jgi:hypothetical protein
MEKDIESFVQKMVKGFKTGGEIGSVLDEFSTSQELANFKSKFQNLLSPEALQKAIETLKSELQAAKAALDAAAAGLSGSTGFTDLPRDISNLLPAAGFTLPEGKDKIATALSGEQKKKLILAAELSGIPFAPDAKLTIFGETYRYDKTKNDLIRQKKPGEKKWSGGKIRGYYAGGGGAIFGAGNSVNDMNLIAASNKEFMMRAKAVEHYGMPFMESINNTLYDPQAIMQKFAKRYDESGKNIISVNVDKIEITEPGASAEEIIDTMEKKLFGAIKRKTDKRYITI